jgi:hypothetical protein
VRTTLRADMPMPITSVMIAAPGYWYLNGLAMPASLPFKESADFGHWGISFYC